MSPNSKTHILDALISVRHSWVLFITLYRTEEGKGVKERIWAPASLKGGPSIIRVFNTSLSPG